MLKTNLCFGFFFKAVIWKEGGGLVDLDLFACWVVGKMSKTIFPQMVVKNDDESHGRIRKKSA